MRILFLFLSVMLVAGSAEADLCSPAWLAGATGSSARALIRAGADVNVTCNTNRNRPLHLAILNDRIDPDVIRALFEAGADGYAQNIHYETPLGYARGRLDRAKNMLAPGTARYRHEQALYELMMNTDNRGSPSSAAAVDAHDKLCDLNWWRSSASESSMKALLATPGVDPNTVCNFNNDRPIHLPLKLTSFRMLTGDLKDAIRTLVDGEADLRVGNGAGQSAYSLAGIRYDRYFDRMVRYTVDWCNGQLTGEAFYNHIVRNNYDLAAYMYIESSATGRSFDEIRYEKAMEVYRVNHPEGAIDYRVLCPLRGVNGPW